MSVYKVTVKQIQQNRLHTYMIVYSIWACFVVVSVTCFIEKQSFTRNSITIRSREADMYIITI